MKIIFLAGYNVIHTVRWVNSLCERGHDVHLLSLHRKGDRLDPRVTKILLPFPPPFGYYLNLPFVRAYIKKMRPDLINAHYASGYGTLGRLTGFHPYILSVWGSDVYDFPNNSTRNHNLIVKNLNSADMVCSTSRAMAKVTQSLSSEIKGISITPFGVDVKKFAPAPQPNKSETLTIGTVKRLEDKYGIDILIRSFATLRKSLALQSPGAAEMLRLLIVGGGSKKEKMIKLADELGVGAVTHFEGAIAYADVPVFLRKMDIYAAFSRLNSESFGVAILEASACGVPVVVSDADGPCEVVGNYETGIIVPKENVHESAEALKMLVLDNRLAARLGAEGRRHVLQNYSWDQSVDILENVYRKAMK